MPDAFEHIRITKEPLINDRRTRDYRIPQPKRDDLRAHGQSLQQNLKSALTIAQQQPGAEDGRCVLKLSYSGILDFKNLEKHGVDFISQEDNQLCIVFADGDGLEKFSEHLAKLGVADSDELKYQQILIALDSVNNWSRQDRESWALKQLGLPPEETFSLDIELWPVATAQHKQRRDLIDTFNTWLNSNNIRIVDHINQDSLLLYRLSLTAPQAYLILEHRDVRLVDLPPRTGITYDQLDIPIETLPNQLQPPGRNNAKICILDSGINTNHPLLGAAVAETASFVYAQGTEDDSGHGTAVAGIALYGNLEDCHRTNQWSPELWLYSGKILFKNPDGDDAAFDDKTIESTLERAVAYFAGDLGCRIFNVSIGNENAPYDKRHIRGIAYTLDRLAREYNALFIVSAGNFRGTETTPRASWYTEYPEYLLADDSIIIDPAPALNVLTVGALANHTANIEEQRYGNREINSLSPAAEDQPSPFTRHGTSIRGAIKPELMAHGGNIASSIRNEFSQLRHDQRRLGVLTLNHDFLGSLLLKDISGTSFAAPYITHLAGRLLNLYPTASANLLRALLVNHSDIPNACEAAFPSELKESIRDVAGYGKVDIDTLFRSTEYEAVLMSEDTIKNNSHHFYELPLPKEFLRGNRSLRQLRVTLAYCPAVRTTRLDYLATRMSFALVKGTSLEEVSRHFNLKTRRETETVSDSSPQNRSVTAKERNRGTVQSSTWSFKCLSPRYKWFVVVTRNDKAWAEGLCAQEENYSLVVTVNDKENQEAKLYTQIRDRIRARERARVK